MNSLTEQAPILVFPFGNPSRGDDALGPAIYQLLGNKQQNVELQSIDLLTDFQLQIEHSIDLENR
ncbi:MAG TPA: Ni/Fe hydrogenase, partial [Gammaproteobacteria bacterium]|nr:Ni/Fe hydrogenase [Gammaproteobacteria bacterium]